MVRITYCYLTFIPQFILGYDGMPRRIADYRASDGWTTANLISTIGAYVTGLSVLVFLVNVGVSWVRRRPAGDDPWEGQTLEVGDELAAAALQLRAPAASRALARAPPRPPRRPAGVEVIPPALWGLFLAIFAGLLLFFTDVLTLVLLLPFAILVTLAVAAYGARARDPVERRVPDASAGTLVLGVAVTLMVMGAGIGLWCVLTGGGLAVVAAVVLLRERVG